MADYKKTGKDDNKLIEYQYVNIANPVMLGIKIGIGMFIVLPLFVIGIMILFAMLGMSL